MQQPDTYSEILLSLKNSIAQLSHWGCRGFDCSDKTVETLNRWTHRKKPSSAKDSLTAVRADLGECRRCDLHHSRTQMVFGQGDAKARIVFLGHGPGANEDQSGRPFAGEAGQLLDRIVGAMKLAREQVYLCDVVKCRRPDDRMPTPEEIRTCRVYWRRQLQVIQPEVICTLGECATRALLETDRPLSQLRGRFHDYGGTKVMPTFHPADLLKDPELKRAVWEDVKKIMAFLRIPL